MAISPVAGAIYANQVAPAASSVQADELARFDLQNAAANEAVNSKEKQVEEARATEEIYKIDHQNEQEQGRQNKQNEQNEQKNLDELESELENIREQESLLEDDKPIFNLSV